MVPLLVLVALSPLVHGTNISIIPHTFARSFNRCYLRFLFFLPSNHQVFTLYQPYFFFVLNAIRTKVPYQSHATHSYSSLQVSLHVPYYPPMPHSVTSIYHLKLLLDRLLTKVFPFSPNVLTKAYSFSLTMFSSTLFPIHLAPVNPKYMLLTWCRLLSEI